MTYLMPFSLRWNLCSDKKRDITYVANILGQSFSSPTFSGKDETKQFVQGRISSSLIKLLVI